MKRQIGNWFTIFNMESFYNTKLCVAQQNTKPKNLNQTTVLRILISRRQAFWLFTIVAKELVVLTRLHPGVTVRLDPATAGRLNVQYSDNTPRCVQK